MPEKRVNKGYATLSVRTIVWKRLNQTFIFKKSNEFLSLCKLIE